jgi:hypothetical protein
MPSVLGEASIEKIALSVNGEWGTRYEVFNGKLLDVAGRTYQRECIWSLSRKESLSYEACSILDQEWKGNLLKDYHAE